MGDRAMAEIRTSEGNLYFYTHWSGFDLPAHARKALDEAAPRKGDDPYALRRIVDVLIRESGTRDSEAGSGLMLKPNAEDEYNHDNPSVVIDIDAWTVEVHRTKGGAS